MYAGDGELVVEKRLRSVPKICNKVSTVLKFVKFGQIASHSYQVSDLIYCW